MSAGRTSAAAARLRVAAALNSNGRSCLRSAISISIPGSV
jgi:hypothetical protein